MSIRWRIIRFVKDVTVGASRLVGVTVARFFLSCCTVFVILWIAVLMYVSFYYAYMPTVSHVKPVFLLFDSECENARQRALCSFPEASLSLSTGERILMRGQRYQVFLDLEMPHSPVNEKLGMFMVKVTFLSDSGKVLASSERSGMLHYQSALLQSLATVFYSVPMVLGFAEEKQIVSINLFEEYVEDSYHPAVGASVIVLSKQIEIYSAALRIEAHFVGLRYIMINWPVTSALLAITFNFFIISTVFFFAYSAFSPDQGYELYEEDPQPAADLDTVTEEQQRALAARSTRREGPGIENVSSTTRLPSSGRLRPRKHRTPRKQANGISNGGLTRCASFPSCRWDKDVPQGAPDSAEHQASCSLHRHGPCYHSNDNLAGSQCCSCLGGIAGGNSEVGGNPAGLQDHRPSADAKIDTEPYYVLNFGGGKMWRSRRSSYADGHAGTGAEDGCGLTRHGNDGDGYLVRRHTFSNLRSRHAWKKVPEHGNLSSSSSMECVHSRMNLPSRRARPLPFNKSYDSDVGCEHDAYGRDCDHDCHHECMECSDLTLDGPLNSRVPDGAASSSEHLNNWAPGAVSTQDSGPISSEQSTSRPLSETDHTVSSNKRSVNRTRARFGLSFKKILSKKDEKSS